MTERRYVLTKIDSGDYLLLSNDATTLWRITRGDEVRDCEGVERYESVWQVWRWRGYIGADAAIAASLVDGDWSEWDLASSWHKSRGEAIEDALRMGVPT